MVMILDEPLVDFLDFSLVSDDENYYGIDFGKNFADYFDYDGQSMLMVVVVKSILVVPL